jgi:disulfide bond formation protein DsbB
MATGHFRLKTVLILALLASIGSLLAAFIAQYGLGLKPCELCLLQRIPYALVIVMALLGLWKQHYGQWLGLLIGTVFLIGSGIAGYHVAVEKQWVKGPVSCTDTGTHAVQSLDEFLKKMQQAPIVACDQPQWDFHGLTMAGMNAIWSFVLAAAVFIAMQQLRRKEEPHA